MTVALLLAALDSGDDLERGSSRDRINNRNAREQDDVQDRLVARVRAGDRDAFGEMYLAFHNELTTFVAGYVRSWLVAEELTQDVFLRLWTRRQDWALSTSVRAYLFGAARNVALNALAHTRVESMHAAAIVSDDRTESNDLDGEDDRIPRLRVALLALPERQRAAVTLRYENDLTYEEIGTTLGVSKVAARNLVVKAETRLRQAL